MDGDSGSGSNSNPNPVFIRACINGRECDVTLDFYRVHLEHERQLERRRREEEEEERGLRRPGIFSPRSSPSSSRRTDRGQRSEHAPPTRIRQSYMYSDRPRRSRGNRAQLPSNSSAEEVATEGSSNELGPTTIAVAANLETLSLCDSPPALDRTDGSRDVACSVDTGSGDLTDSIITAQSPVEVEEALSSSQVLWGSVLAAPGLDASARQQNRTLGVGNRTPGVLAWARQDSQSMNQTSPK